MTFLDEPVPAGSGGQRHLPTEGPHAALLVHIGDMGQVLKDFPGSPPKIIHGIKFFVQLDEVLPEGSGDHAGEPFMLSTDGAVALSKHSKSALYGLLKPWRSKELPTSGIPDNFLLGKLLGQPLTVNVLHVEKKDGTTRAKIGGFMPPMPGAPKLVSKWKGEPEWFVKAREADNQRVTDFIARQSFGTTPSKGVEPFTGPVGGGKTLAGFPGSAEVSDANEDGNGLPVPF